MLNFICENFSPLLIGKSSIRPLAVKDWRVVAIRPARGSDGISSNSSKYFCAIKASSGIPLFF